jgi:ATP-dependent DNA helicase RecG
MITREELDKLLPEIESDKVEKTESFGNNDKKIGEAICSFSNDFPAHQKPGYLILGVRDNGQRSGLKVTDDTLQSLMDYRSDGRIVPPPTLSVARFNYTDGDVAVVEVIPSFQPPVRFKGKVCIRIGPRKAEANEAEERILAERRSSFARSFDTLPCYGSTLSDLSIDLFKTTYLPTAVDPEIVKTNNRDLKTQLASLKFYDLKADCPTNAGVLLFGLNPKFYLPGSYIQYVKFEGLSEAAEPEREKEFSGALITELLNIDGFVRDRITQEKVIATSPLHERKYFNYPYFAIRELLLNAIMHRDYQSNAPIRLYEFSDRIEIINPGGLFGIARPENFPTRNDYRNPTIAEALKNLGYVNRFNRGIIRIKDELVKNESKEPQFQFNEPNSFGAIIYSKEL